VRTWPGGTEVPPGSDFDGDAMGESNVNNEDQASKAAAFYDEYHQASDEMPADHPIRLKTKKIHLGWLKNLKPESGSRLLDLSCGLGHFLSAAREYEPGLELHGLDHSAYAVRKAMNLVPGARIVQGDAMATPYPDKHFDRVTCLGSLEHYPDPVAGLKEIRRILKDDGKALVYVPNLFFLGYVYFVWRTGEEPHEAGQNEYEHFHTLQGWRDLIAKNGLRELSVAKHNEMFATERFGGAVKGLYHYGLEPFVPLTLSYCFAFILGKDGTGTSR